MWKDLNQNLIKLNRNRIWELVNEIKTYSTTSLDSFMNKWFNVKRIIQRIISEMQFKVYFIWFNEQFLSLIC